MNRTSIEWTDFSSNPLKYRDADGKVVHACVHASPGCQHCYAETIAKRVQARRSIQRAHDREGDRLPVYFGGLAKNFKRLGGCRSTSRCRA